MVSNAVNVPSVSSDVLSKVGPYLTLAEMLGSFHMQIAKGRCGRGQPGIHR